MKISALLFLIFFIINGCAGISYNEFQDADTLEKATSALSLGFTAGLEGRYQFPIGGNTDMGVSLWSVNIINPLTDDHDIGLKLSWKHLLTKKENRNKLSLITNLFAYSASYKQLDLFSFNEPRKVNYSALGTSFGIIYSYSFNRKIDGEDEEVIHKSTFPFSFNSFKNIYVGIKINYLKSDAYIFDNLDSSKTLKSAEEIFVFPFIGISFGEQFIKYAEFAYLTHSLKFDNNFKPRFYISFGIKYTFGL